MIAPVLAEWKRAVLAGVTKVAKVSTADVERIYDEMRTAVDPERIAQLKQELKDALAQLNADAGIASLESVADTNTGDLAAMLSQVNVDAVDYASQRAADLVTDIADTTRDDLRSLVTRGINEGWTNDELSSNISDAFTFDESRADLIARTETAFAENAGTIAGWKASGVVEGKQWAADPEACDDCADLDGTVVGIDEAFDEDVDGPPLHPNCECTLLAVLTQPGDEEE